MAVCHLPPGPPTPTGAPLCYHERVRSTFASLGGSLALATLCAGVALSGFACGAFTSDDPVVDAGGGSSSSSSGASGSSSSSGAPGDSGADAAPRDCREERNDFEGVKPLEWFDTPTIDTETILKITTAPAPKGSFALFAQVDVPATGGGKTAIAPRKMDIGAAKVAEIELDAYFGRAPAGTYVEVGCELIARKSPTEMGVTTRVHLEIQNTTLQLGGASNDGTGLLPNQPVDQDLLTVDAPTWHHVLLRMDLASGVSSARVDDSTRTIKVPPAATAPQVLSTKCGVYADQAIGRFETYIDNVAMRLCAR